MKTLRKHSKKTKLIAAILFVATLFFNIQVSFRNTATGSSKFSFDNMEVSLFEKAQAWTYMGLDTEDPIWYLEVYPISQEVFMGGVFLEDIVPVIYVPKMAVVVLLVKIRD